MTPPSLAVRPHQDTTRAKRWGVHYRIATDNPKKRKPVSKFFVTAEEAHAFKAEWLAEWARVHSGTTVQPATSPTTETPATRVVAGTVAAFVRDWLAYVETRYSAATYKSYETMARLYILPAKMGPTTFGTYEMKALTSGVVRRMYDALQASGVQLGTRKQVHRAFGAACTMAVLEEVLDHNPCHVLGRRLRHKTDKVASDEEKANPMTASEMLAFMARVQSHEPEWVEYFQFLFDTGARIGEAAALKWDTVELKGKVAKVVASYCPVAREDKDPKTPKSKRDLALTALNVQQLTDLRKRQRVEALRRGLSPRVYVFTTKSGTPRRQDGNMYAVFHRVCKEVGITGKTPHSIRDTFATLHLLADWSSLPWVSARLGHEKETTTIKHYFKYQPTAATKDYADRIRSAQ